MWKNFSVMTKKEGWQPTGHMCGCLCASLSQKRTRPDYPEASSSVTVSFDSSHARLPHEHCGSLATVS